jgi:hypothetical protein
VRDAQADTKISSGAASAGALRMGLDMWHHPVSTHSSTCPRT